MKKVYGKTYTWKKKTFFKFFLFRLFLRSRPLLTKRRRHTHLPRDNARLAWRNFLRELRIFLGERNRGARRSINLVDCKVSTVTCAKTFRVSRKNIDDDDDDDSRRRVPFTPLFIIFRAEPPAGYTHAKLFRRIPRGIGVRFHCEVAPPENGNGSLV